MLMRAAAEGQRWAALHKSSVELNEEKLSTAKAQLEWLSRAGCPTSHSS
jgi:hypothetical protein